MNQFNYEKFKKVLNIMEEQVPKRKIRFDDWEYAFNIYMLGKENIAWNTIALNQLATVLLKARVNYLDDRQSKIHKEKQEFLKMDLEEKTETITLNIEGLNKTVKTEAIKGATVKKSPESVAKQKEILTIIKETAKKTKEKKVVEYQKRTSKETLKLISDLLKTGKYLRTEKTIKNTTDLSALETKVLQMIQGMEILQKEFNEKIEAEKATLQKTANELKMLLGYNTPTLVGTNKKVR